MGNIINTLLFTGLLAIMGSDCKYLGELQPSSYAVSGLRQNMYYCKSRNLVVSTLTARRDLWHWKRFPLFYLIDYKEDGSCKETWKDEDEDGLSGNEKLYWRGK
jgi:hypothetical protein